MESKDGTWIMYGVSEDDPECLHTVDELIGYIEEVGFLPLFRNEIPGFSVEERTTEKYWWSEDAQMDPWVWREIIARRGDIAYGKFFHNKADLSQRNGSRILQITEDQDMISMPDGMMSLHHSDRRRSWICSWMTG